MAGLIAALIVSALLGDAPQTNVTPIIVVCDDLVCG